MRQTKVAAIFLAGMFGLGAIADAKTPSTKPSGVHAVILGVQPASSQITVRIGTAKTKSIQTVHITIGPGITIEGKNHSSGSFSTLHAGDRIIIEPDTSNPTTIVDLGGSGSHRKRVK